MSFQRCQEACIRLENWLTIEQEQTLLRTFDRNTLRGKRDYAMVAVLSGCGLRGAELSSASVEDLQRREEHWGFADLIGKGVVTRQNPSSAGLGSVPGVAPHDLRQTCARLCHDAGGEIEQIQYLLGNESVQTTAR